MKTASISGDNPMFTHNMPEVGDLVTFPGVRGIFTVKEIKSDANDTQRSYIGALSMHLFSARKVPGLDIWYITTMKGR